MAEEGEESEVCHVEDLVPRRRGEQMVGMREDASCWLNNIESREKVTQVCTYSTFQKFLSQVNSDITSPRVHF